MVAKLVKPDMLTDIGYLLAKIHMVAKREKLSEKGRERYLLAKIHMVAKPICKSWLSTLCYLLAKIHMVAKPQTDFIT